MVTKSLAVPEHDLHEGRVRRVESDDFLHSIECNIANGNWGALYSQLGLGGAVETEILKDTEKFAALATLLVRRFQVSLDLHTPLGVAIADYCTRAGTISVGQSRAEHHQNGFDKADFIGQLIASDSETVRRSFETHHAQIIEQDDLIPYVVKRCLRMPPLLLPHSEREQHAALYELVGGRCVVWLRDGTHPALKHLVRGELDTPPLTDSTAQLNAAKIYRDLEALVLDPLPAWKTPTARGDGIRVGLLRHAYAPTGEMEYVDVLTNHIDAQVRLIRIGVAPARGEDGYVSLAGLDELGALECVRALQLDVLIHTTALWGSFGSTIARLLTARMAPIQIMSLGEIRSTAIPSVDYFVFPQDILGENFADQFTETLLPVPWGAPRQRVLYQPHPTEKPHDAARCVMMSNAHVRKISHELLHAWAQILARVPGAEIWLFPFSADYHLAQRTQLTAVIEAACEAAGVASERFVIRMERGPDVLQECMSGADLYLDSFPYNGHFSLAEALAARLPCVCFSTAAYHSQLSRMLLASLGLDRQLLASSEEDYIDRAVKLGRNAAERISARNLIDEVLRNLNQGEDEARYGQSFWTSVVNIATNQHRNSRQ